MAWPISDRNSQRTVGEMTPTKAPGHADPSHSPFAPSLGEPPLSLLDEARKERDEAGRQDGVDEEVDHRRNRCYFFQNRVGCVHKRAEAPDEGRRGREGGSGSDGAQ